MNDMNDFSAHCMQIIRNLGVDCPHMVKFLVVLVVSAQLKRSMTLSMGGATMGTCTPTFERCGDRGTRKSESTHKNSSFR